jgi:hypothetical protein
MNEPSQKTHSPLGILQPKLKLTARFDPNVDPAPLFLKALPNLQFMGLISELSKDTLAVQFSIGLCTAAAFNQSRPTSLHREFAQNSWMVGIGGSLPGGSAFP